MSHIALFGIIGGLTVTSLAACRKGTLASLEEGGFYKGQLNGQSWKHKHRQAT